MVEERNGAVSYWGPNWNPSLAAARWFTVIEGREERKGTRLRVARFDYTLLASIRHSHLPWSSLSRAMRRADPLPSPSRGPSVTETTV
jgi:hypothetical protein